MAPDDDEFPPPPSQLPLPMASTSHIGTLTLGMHTQVFTRHIIKERHPPKDAPINNNTQVIIATLQMRWNQHFQYAQIYIK